MTVYIFAHKGLSQIVRDVLTCLPYVIFMIILKRELMPDNLFLDGCLTLLISHLQNITTPRK